MEFTYTSLAALAGGLAAGVFGYLSSGAPFTAHKFFPTFLRSIAAGGAVAVAYSTATGVSTIADLAMAFAAGAGVDVLGHRLAGTIKK